MTARAIKTLGPILKYVEIHMKTRGITVSDPLVMYRAKDIKAFKPPLVLGC